MKKILLVILMLLVATPAFSYYRKMIIFKKGEGQFSNEKDGKGLNGHLIWIKNKRKNVDISLTLENNYSKPIYLDPANIKLTFNGVRGALWPVKNFPKQLEPGELTGKKVMIFEFEPEADKEGEVVITINPLIEMNDKDKAAPPLVFKMQIQK